MDPKNRFIFSCDINYLIFNIKLRNFNNLNIICDQFDYSHNKTIYPVFLLSIYDDNSLVTRFQDTITFYHFKDLMTVLFFCFEHNVKCLYFIDHTHKKIERCLFKPTIDKMESPINSELLLSDFDIVANTIRLMLQSTETLTKNDVIVLSNELIERNTLLVTIIVHQSKNIKGSKHFTFLKHRFWNYQEKKMSLLIGHFYNYFASRDLVLSDDELDIGE